jgi:hypothetical protein
MTLSCKDFLLKKTKKKKKGRRDISLTVDRLNKKCNAMLCKQNAPEGLHNSNWNAKAALYWPNTSFEVYQSNSD